MTSKSTEDRARYFMAYGFSTDFEATMEFGSYSYDDAVRAICVMNIRIAAQFYTDELADVDDLDKLSTDTLAILAAVMTAKTGAN